MSGRSPEELRGRMTVQFQGEEGIDAGGLTREWYDILAKEIFNADYALFINTAQDNSTFQPNRFSYYNPNHLDYFKFVGRVIGMFPFRYCNCLAETLTVLSLQARPFWMVTSCHATLQDHSTSTFWGLLFSPAIWKLSIRSTIRI